MKFLPACFALLCLVLTACSKSDSHAGHGEHVHRAPHGGTLVELGEHAYNLEIVRDAAAGKLTVYVLDGHAENFVRITASSLDATITIGAEKKSLTLAAVANPVTGETVGNTSQFEAQADSLKSPGALSLTINSVEIRGTKFTNITATPKS
jgi:hypothetical protein